MVSNSISADHYAAFRDYLEDICGIVLGDNKHYLVMSRLGRLMTELGIEDLGTLVTRLRGPSGRALREQVIEAMTTNETLWFRDTFPFDILRDMILPEFAEKRTRGRLRIWSAACSSGQEPYSISMITQEYMEKNPGKVSEVEIVATDISPAIIKEAQEATYDAITLARGLSEERKRRFFTQHGLKWAVNDNIKRRVRFTQQNLLQNYSMLGKFDVIFCRNVLIYFSSESKRDILSRMARALNPGGFLFLGSSEATTQYSDDFELVRAARGSVYRVRDKLPATRPAAAPTTAAARPVFPKRS